MTRNRCRRRGAAILESAIVYPLTLLFLIGLAVGGIGMFRYQQVASLAREGARYASVRGGQYAEDTGHPAATADDVYQKVVLAKAAGLDPTQLDCSVTWNPDNWPSHVTSSTGSAAGSTISVTVTYHWVPEAYLGGITLKSTAVLPMSY
jgi:Flp pilus assembly protein TadG